jgi:predicted acylesterase/phospholipase RssA
MGRDGNLEQEAVVLSGGGAKGAYEVGVLQALIAGQSPATGYRPLEPAIYTGTSVGAYNVSFLAAKGGLPATAAIVASASIPGIFPPVPIDGVLFVDGGVLMNTPLKPAIRDGADVLHVVYLDPCLLDVPFPRYPNTLDTFYRLYAIQQAKAFRRDTATVAAFNLKAAADGSYRLLTVHNYRPQTDLGGALGLLDFRQEVVDSLIAQGYQDAVNHDCTQSQCVFPLSERKGP